MVNWLNPVAAGLERMGVGITDIWEVDRMPDTAMYYHCISSHHSD